MKRIHIFKTGTHTDSHGQTLTFGESDLAAAIAAYDPSLHQAPIVVGHPTTEAPAYGWVQSLTSDNGNLFATPEQVNAEFSEQVAAGSYKKVSASFYPPNSPTNPVKGSYYLRHVGFLGAEPPAIKGLQPIEFNEDADVVTLTVDFAEAKKSAFESFVSAMQTLFFGESNTTETTTHDQNLNTDTQKDDPMSDPTIPPVPPVPATPPAVPAAATANTTDKDAQIAALQAQLDAKTQAESSAKTQASEKENADFAESLVSDGKVSPASKTMVTAILDALDRDSGNSPVDFGEGDAKQPLKQAVKETLTKADASTFAHLFSEAASVPAHGKVGFDAPSGTAVDSDRLALHQQAVTYAEAHKVDYSTAIIAIGG
ncbi:phage protease [Psychrobacter aquaticus]|uniref:Peptidase n=1 Tax=Psychrobacter aquaticus CMS 56 TaxID=1354303 RepID=U4T5H1_9GAMM|nr:hypothetical protein [Psychrobacter aquaticus]ERL56145.1 hypothetical protein M917_0823 [Psychrobacter aquaticus CMS 56]